MRRIVVTPTFAAGLGVIVAAVFAYPLAARAVLYYRDRVPSGQPCTVKGCGAGQGAGIPDLASARPGYKLETPAPATPSPWASGPRTPGAGGSSPSASPPGGNSPVVHYQAMSQGQGRFQAALAVLPTPGQPFRAWRLEITYPSARIVGVRGGRVLSQSVHTVVVGPAGQDGGWDGVNVVIEVAGPAGPPGGCVFNGRACDVVTGGQGGSRGGNH